MEQVTPEVFQAFMEASLFGKKRQPRSRQDFGDDATVGLHVRVKDIDYFAASPYDYIFGRFLGYQRGVWIIATSNSLSFTPTQIKEYTSLEALKEVWELD